MAQIIICDVCGTKKNVARKHYAYDRRSDGVGGREDVYKMFDLCQTHELLALSRAFKASLGIDTKTESEMNRLIIAEVTKMMR